MAQAVDEEPKGARRRRWPAAVAILAGLIVLALAAVWLTRERIAGSVIAGQLKTYGLPATYRIESIGPRRQVLSNVVIGDPARPDLTVERIEVGLVPTFGVPAIGRVVLVRPRLHGRWTGDRLSFGSLDKALYGSRSQAPFRLPDMDLAIVDGRGRIDSPFGAAGVKIEGQGPLRGGFAGTLAAIAPRIEAQGCRADRATVYGRLTVLAEKPRFAGPVRLGHLDCPASRLSLDRTGLQVDATLDKALDGIEGTFGLEAGTLALAGNRMLGLDGKAGLAWRNGALTARYDLAGHELAGAQAQMTKLSTAGVLRSTGDRMEVEGELRGDDVELGAGLDTALGDAQAGAIGTLAAPLLGQLRAALRSEGDGSRLAVSYLLRQGTGATNLVLPQAALRGGSGATLLSLSRFQFTLDGRGAPRIAGNFATGGPGLPQIAGRVERQPGGRLVSRLTMADYRAGDARVALPRLTVIQLAGGALGFSGEALLSGPLPGGQARNLAVPLEGGWSAARGLAAWRRCTTLRFDRLELADLRFDRRALALCPPRGGAILAADSRGLRIAAGAPALDLAGWLGETPIRLRSGPVGLAWPGTLAARSLDVALGPPVTASRFRIANLSARLGGEVAGTFSGSDVRLAAVPLDLLDAAGSWRFAGGRLALTDATFRLEDREQDDRFQPLTAQGAALTLADNRITARAPLREPGSGREVVEAAIGHDLSTGRGHADLSVPGVQFDDRLQPEAISRLALGVVANVRGSLRGSGRIDWTPHTVTSTGRFVTDSLDFAAAFGPVKGASGTIVFTDLLGMVTAPDQQLRIGSINPGIEVNDGLLTYELRPGSVLAVKGAAWPFLDGTLTLLPVTMRMGVAEERRYTLMIAGLNAARFVERMELANLAATGVFDGTLPLVFDQNGGRIDGGQLRSRPPGGNVSYVGALTYKDLSTMANFAFDALKSLDYQDMQIGMNGPLEGEIVTRVQFAGIRQGATARRNFLTARIARLPIRFNVNVRAPFFKLATTFKSFYDPAYVADPRTLGLIDAQGRAIPRAPAKPAVQPSESAAKP